MKLAVNKFSVSPLILDPEEVFDFEVPNCDFTTPLIVDGEKTKAGEFPHMAAIGWEKEDGQVGEFPLMTLASQSRANYRLGGFPGIMIEK